ncbi:hypothetical protein J1N35_024522 [Gossypium stocksii]|uniref:Hcy-binding domain-containing protein n=1 Tax=Gossypium stocksii TaxID=47602 RepID=A0A9D3V4V2_9ROSI|nr:hypothetical protein J1N35_024522 [Gossypium stocksii]
MLWSAQLLHKYGNRSQNILYSFRTLTSVNSLQDGVGCFPGNSYNRALVAALIRSYGAYLADGSEYSGCYGPGVNLDKLKDFYGRRLQVIVEAGPDLLAFETIPNKLEAQACVELLEEENIQIPSWIFFSSVDGENAPSGESLRSALRY